MVFGGGLVDAEYDLLNFISALVGNIEQTTAVFLEIKCGPSRGAWVEYWGRGLRWEAIDRVSI